MTRPLIAPAALLMMALLPLGCGSTRVGTRPEDARQQGVEERSEIPTAGIDRQTETTPIVTVDIDRSSAEPVTPASAAD